jgi:hypothetical protein
MSEELDKKLDLELDEAKATGEDSVAADAVTPAGGSPKGKNRKADKNQSVDPTADNIEKSVKTPQGSNDEGLKEESEEDSADIAEAFEGLFEGTDLSEEFKTKVSAVFEAAVHEKVLAEKAELQEKFESDLEEQVGIVTSELVEKVDSYLDYVIEQWMEANEVAVENNIKVEVAESLLDSLKGLVTEHNLDIDNETLDLVAEADAKAEEANAKYNEVIEQVISLKEAKEELENKLAFAEVTEGLTATQVEKLAVLAEGITFENSEEYKSKVSAIKENYFAESVVTPEDQTEYLEEAVEEEKVVVADDVDPTVAAYAASLGRLAK